MAPAIGQAIGTPRDQDGMLAGDQLRPLGRSNTGYVQGDGAQQRELDVWRLAPDRWALGRTMTSITAAGAQGHGGNGGAEQAALGGRVLLICVGVQIDIMAWPAAQHCVKGDDALTFLEGLRPALVQAMLEYFARRAIPFVSLVSSSHCGFRLFLFVV